MSGIRAGRAMIINGAGRGLGRAHALAFAREGARLVVNDTGAEQDGTGRDHGPAGAVTAEVRELGGEAVPSYEDVASWDGSVAPPARHRLYVIRRLVSLGQHQSFDHELRVLTEGADGAEGAGVVRG